MSDTGKIYRLARLVLLAPLLWAMPALLHAQTAPVSSVLTVERSSYGWSESVNMAAPENALAKTDIERPDISRYAVKSSVTQAARPGNATDSYGPFRVVNAQRAEVLGDINSGAAQLFANMLSRHPGISRIDFIDCPGTNDDAAIFAIARMIRARNIATHVPDGGFVGSGGVDLFLAGAIRSAAPSAEFAVHSWIDQNGMQAGDFAIGDPVHQEYLSYYREIGMEREKALAFYRLTNSAPFEDALYLKPHDIAQFIPLRQATLYP